MARYVRIRAERTFWLEDDAQPTDWKGGGQSGIDIYEPDDDGPVDTGVLDVDGVPIGRVSERNPIGFRLVRS
jgi:hypothetical protein